MTLYVDSSTLLKLYADEVDSPKRNASSTLIPG
jgi:hypothetical protein